MNYNNILISILFLFTTSTVITNGVLMLNEKDKLNFDKLSSFEKGYVFCLIYSEIYLALILVYNIIYYLYYFIFSCYSEGELKFNYSCWKALFLFSGIATHIFLFFILVTQTSVIDSNIHTINIIFNTNLIITVVVTIIFKFLKLKNNNTNISYENLD